MRRIFVGVLIGSLLMGCLPTVGKTPNLTAIPRAILTIMPQSDIRVLPKANRPNILFILTDDLDADLNTIGYMPHLQELITSQGLTINDYFISQPLCCPSRATMLRGQYTHNHGVYRNDPPNGGFEQFYFLQNESSTLATWLQAAGYRTILLGKYLNGYPFPEDRAYIPVGWDEWYSSVKGSPFAGYKYTLNENGKQVDYNETGQGESQYMTDVLARKAEDFIRRSSADQAPFFVYLSTYAPHSPVKPAHRHEALLPDLKAPRTASFNEADVSDKPAGLRFDPLLSDEEIKMLDQEYRARVLTMQAVDEMIAQLVDVLKETDQLDNTYIIFTSDNGYHLGQHRLRSGKATPYEEDIHVPFIIRGPHIEANTTLQGYVTGNVDFAPTIAEMAGIIPPDYVDGRSMFSLFDATSRSLANTWRSGYLLEFYGYNEQNENPNAPAPKPEYLGLRTLDYLYVEYQDGFIELYDLKNDPYEMENIAATADKALLQHFSEWLHALSACAGRQCATLDQDPAK
jgi:N-acetylglucosamine-6-sulfatase